MTLFSKRSKDVKPPRKSYTKTVAALSGSILFVVWLIWGNMTIQLSQITISDQSTPKEFNNFKIAQLSDLHDKDWGRALIEPLKEENPDIIVITGDLIDSKTPDIYQATELIKQIQKIAPIYFVSGNHEAWSGQYAALEEALLTLDVTILDNDSVILQKENAEILLLGLKDPAFKSSYYDMATEIQQLKEDFDGFSILLSHRPERFASYVSSDVNLVLSGHAHGGQFRLPFFGGVIAPDQGFLPTYTSGVYKEKNTNMIVSRGLGNSIIPIRVNNRPELVIIELKSSR